MINYPKETQKELVATIPTSKMSWKMKRRHQQKRPNANAAVKIKKQLKRNPIPVIQTQHNKKAKPLP